MTTPTLSDTLQGCVVRTDVGVMAEVHNQYGLVAVRMGYTDLDQLTQLIYIKHPGVRLVSASPVASLLTAYAAGEEVSFDSVTIDDRSMSVFRRNVTNKCRRIPYGDVATYAQLAKQAGSPGAGRAVGSVMAHNPVPIIVPCHRVVRSDGGYGGFSAPQGIELKKKLLRLEGCLVGA